MGAILLVAIYTFIKTISECILGVALKLPLAITTLATAAVVLMVICYAGVCVPPTKTLAVLDVVVPDRGMLLCPLRVLIKATMVVLVSQLLFVGQRGWGGLGLIVLFCEKGWVSVFVAVLIAFFTKVNTTLV